MRASWHPLLTGRWLATLVGVVAVVVVAAMYVARSDRAYAVSIVVDTTSDDNLTACTAAAGDCSLRGAINNANGDSGLDTIQFNIGTGVQTITPGAGGLPTIAYPVIIDGTTQPGYTAAPIIELDGSGAGASADGLRINSGNSTVRGLVINRFSDNGVEFGAAGGNVLEGSFIGTDVTGTVDLGNFRGVHIDNIPDNRVGGTTAAARNIISGNNHYFAAGVNIVGFLASGNVVQGNYIGIDVTGTADLGNFTDGVFIGDYASDNTVGGDTPGARNVISSNGRNGIVVYNGAQGNVIQGNYIGTDASGAAVLGNVEDGIHMAGWDSGVYDTVIGGTTGTTPGASCTGACNLVSGNGQDGIEMHEDIPSNTTSSGNIVQGNYIGTDVTGTADLGNTRSGIYVNNIRDNTIGGTTAASRNVISGNERMGVNISASPDQFGASATGNAVVGNFIGTSADGTAALGNGLNGVFINGPANSVGGAAAGAGNRIAFNALDGIFVAGGAGNRLSSNSIFGNGDLGIDLGANGVLANDPDDPDTGANELQNYPVLTAASSGSTSVEGNLDSIASTQFTLEFFYSGNCDVSGSGEGASFLGSAVVTTDGAGEVTFAETFGTNVAPGDFVTATVTDPAGNTSEFSECEVVTGAPTPDGDLDGVADSVDNCPDWPNSGQELPSWPVPAGDSDCDGFDLARETTVGTLATQQCAGTVTVNDEPVDAWPPDFNDSRLVSLADVLMMGPVYNQATGGDPARMRFDLNASGSVTLADVLLMGPFYNKSCS